MSQSHSPVGLAVEWSPRGVIAYDSANRRTLSGNTVADLNLGSREVVLALSRRSVFVRTTRVPNASVDEVRAILTMRAADLFPIPLIDLAWDFQLTEDINDEGRLAMVAAIPCADLRRALDAVESAGLRVKASVPLALGAAIIAQDLSVTDAIVLERSEDGPAVEVIVHHAVRSSRAAPSNTSFDQEIPRALALTGVDYAPVIAAGGTTFPGAERTTERTALQALAEAAYDRLKIKIRLPESIAAEAAAAERRTMVRSLFFLFSAVAIAGLSFWDYADAKSLVAQRQVQSNARLQKFKNEAKKTKAELTRFEGMSTALNQAFKPAQPLSDVVAAATAAVPAGVWLNAITLERGRPLQMRGTAKAESAVALLLRGLATQKEGRFRDVVLTNASNTLVNKVPVVQFVVTAFPVGNLPVSDKDKGTAKGAK